MSDSPTLSPAESADAAPAPEAPAVEQVHDPVETDLSPKAMRRLVTAALAAVLGILALGTYFTHRSSHRTDRRIVCFGDSLTSCGGWGGRFSDFLALDLPDCEVINKGIGGDTIGGGRWRLRQDVLSLKPRVAVIALGANDFIQASRPLDLIREDLEFILARCRDSKIQVVFASVFGPHLNVAGKEVPKVHPPNTLARATPELGYAIQKMEQELCAKYGALYLPNMQYDLNRPEHWTDANHPSAAGNKLVAARLLPLVQEALEKSLKERPAEE
ncbi:MAG: hypothetical protein HS116_16160 [Planctomycetes bacterium]|nr:hypothetical protein [Planctomycetota bacterium]